MRLVVIIPVCDGGRKLRKCFETVPASARRPGEGVIVDDASTAGSGDLAGRYGVRVARFEVSARSPAFPRNPGASVAVCDMLIIAGSDIALHAHALALAVKKLSPSDASVAACFGSYGDERPARGSFLV